jgi:hypothetical protein
MRDGDDFDDRRTSDIPVQSLAILLGIDKFMSECAGR